MNAIARAALKQWPGLESARQQAQRRILTAVDAVLIVAAMALAGLEHSLLRRTLPFFREPPTLGEYAILLPIVLPVFLVCLALRGLDRSLEQHWSRAALLGRLLQVHALVFVAIASLTYVTQRVINRSLVGLFLGTTLVLLYSDRALLSRWQRFQHRTGEGRSRILVVGAWSAELAAFVEAALARYLPPLFVGRVGAPDPAEASSALSWLGDVQMLSEILHREAVDEVLYFPPAHVASAQSPGLSECEALGIPARFCVPLPQPLSAPARIVGLYEQPFISYESAPKSPEALAVKHAFDAVVAGIVLLLASPVLLLAALGIWITMGRPIFFSQERAGLFGRRFRMLKFRTMAKDAETRRAEVESLNEMKGPVFKAQRDPRITPLGRILRKSSIDELPQLFHVLQGRMSLVGPRPLPVREQEAIVGWHRRRLSMKPGLTGLWQVSGRNDLTFEEWMRLDLEYVDRWSLWLDVKILLRTIPTVLFGRGAR